jgi:hypothetical protein
MLVGSRDGRQEESQGCVPHKHSDPRAIHRVLPALIFRGRDFKLEPSEPFYHIRAKHDSSMTISMKSPHTSWREKKKEKQTYRSQILSVISDRRNRGQQLSERPE